jgi:hypothetical protein
MRDLRMILASAVREHLRTCIDSAIAENSETTLKALIVAAWDFNLITVQQDHNGNTIGITWLEE